MINLTFLDTLCRCLFFRNIILHLKGKVIFMKKINTENFRKPTKKEIEKIFNTIKERKTMLIDGGEDISATSILLTIISFSILTLCKMFSQNIEYILLPLFLLEIGICALIGSRRAKKELDYFRDGLFIVKEGYIKEIEKQTCWYQKLVVYADKQEFITIKVFGKKFKRNNKILIALIDDKSIKWAVPRIFKK